MTVDDLKTPSTAEISVPIGTKRTGWASEAPAAKKAQIAEVLAATSVQEGVANAEEAILQASKRMSSKSSKGRGARKERRPGFKRAFDKREGDKRAERAAFQRGGPNALKGGGIKKNRGRGRK